MLIYSKIFHNLENSFSKLQFNQNKTMTHRRWLWSKFAFLGCLLVSNFAAVLRRHRTYGCMRLSTFFWIMIRKGVVHCFMRFDVTDISSTLIHQIRNPPSVFYGSKVVSLPPLNDDYPYQFVSSTTIWNWRDCILYRPRSGMVMQNCRSKKRRKIGHFC